MQIRFLFLVLLMVVGLNATTPTKENVTRLYIATFDRAPDSAGIDYWIYESGLNLEGIASSFFEQPETIYLYRDVSDTVPFTELSYADAFISDIYYNLFKRGADHAGISYWAGELMSGNIIPSHFILAVINGAVGDDKKILDNKTEVALVFADSGLEDIAISEEIMDGVDATDQSVIDALNRFGLGED